MVEWYMMDNWSFKESLGDTIMEKYEALYVKLFALFNKVGGPAYVICGEEVGSIFENATPGFVPAAFPGGITVAFRHLGRINDKFEVYADKSLKDLVYVCGKTGIYRLRIKDFLI